MRSSPLVRSAFFLAFLTLACRAGDTSAPATPPPHAVEMVVAAASPTATSSVVGSAVSELPAVVIQDVRGVPLAGVPVTFAVTRGGGAIVGVTTTTKVVTNAIGVATLGSWTVGSRPGPNEVTATVASVPSVRFVVNAVVGPPAAIRRIQGDDQFAPAGSMVAVRPAVRVVDALDNGVSGVAVTFAIADGDGTVTGSAVITDSAGLAAVESWTLGSALHQSLAVTVLGLDRVLFVAEAMQGISACVPSAVLADGMKTSSALTSRSCRGADGRFLETFTVLSTRMESYEFTLVSSDFDTYLELRDERGRRPVANSDGDGSVTSSRVKAILPPGTFTVVVSSAQPERVGSYTIAYTLASSDVTGCVATAIARGAITTQQIITRTDCVNPPRSEDRYRVWIAARTSLAIHLEDWSYSEQYFEVSDSKGAVLEMSRMTSFYNYEVHLIAPADGYYYITVVGGPFEWGISYTLGVR